MSSITRLYTGPDGQTHIEPLDPATHPELTTLQATKGVVFRTTQPGYFSDWHNAPRRQYVITLTGEVGGATQTSTGALRAARFALETTNGVANEERGTMCARSRTARSARPNWRAGRNPRQGYCPPGRAGNARQSEEVVGDRVRV